MSRCHNKFELTVIPGTFLIRLADAARLSAKDRNRRGLCLCTKCGTLKIRDGNVHARQHRRLRLRRPGTVHRLLGQEGEELSILLLEGRDEHAEAPEGDPSSPDGVFACIPETPDTSLSGQRDLERMEAGGERVRGKEQGDAGRGSSQTASRSREVPPFGSGDHRAERSDESRRSHHIDAMLTPGSDIYRTEAPTDSPEEQDWVNLGP